MSVPAANQAECKTMTVIKVPPSGVKDQQVKGAEVEEAMIVEAYPMKEETESEEEPDSNQENTVIVQGETFCTCVCVLVELSVRQLWLCWNAACMCRGSN